MKRLLSIFLILSLLLASGCSVSLDSGNEEAKFQKQVYAMDTVMILTCYGEKAEAALNAAEERIYALEEDLSPDSGSLGAVNRNAGQWTSVSQDCLNVAKMVLTIREETNGALAPELFPLIKAWGFIDEQYRVVSDQEIHGFLASFEGFRMEINEESSCIKISAGSEITFGSIVKGYTSHQIIELFRQEGVEHAIVSLGGNVQTLGEYKANGSRWSVAITDPADTGDYFGTLSVGECAVITSGGYHRYFIQDGITYIHILDPETGKPSESNLLSLTVVCPDGTRADGLSTSLFVLDVEGALNYYRTYHNCELILVTKDGNVLVTEGLKDSFQASDTDYSYTFVS